MQLASAARAHLVGLVRHSELLPGIEARAFIDIDSLLRPVFGHQKQGASYGHTKIGGKQVLRKVCRSNTRSGLSSGYNTWSALLVDAGVWCLSG